MGYKGCEVCGKTMRVREDHMSGKQQDRRVNLTGPAWMLLFPGIALGCVIASAALKWFIGW